MGIDCCRCRDVAEARETWRTSQQGLDPHRLIFIDETGTATNMARRYGRARRGDRLVAKLPHGHWKTTTFVAGLRTDGIAAPTSLRAIRGTFEHHILPRWRDRNVTSLRATDLFLLLKRVAERRGHIGGPGAAHDVKKRLNRMAKLAQAQGLLEVNYFADVQAPYKYVERSRTPTLKEARQILARITEHDGYPYGPFFRLLLLAGLRRSELARTERAWLEDDVLVIPPEATKTKRAPHAVPLTEQMRGVIDELPLRGRHLFTSNGTAPLSGWTKATDRMRAYCDAGHFTMHDFRRSMATEMGRMRIPGDIIERCLGHAQPQLQRAYRKYEYIEEKREALQRWNDALTGR